VKFLTKLSYKILRPPVYADTVSENQIYEEMRQDMINKGFSRSKIESALLGVKRYVGMTRQNRKLWRKHFEA